MQTKLPEKLVTLRKHFGFSQQEIAQKLDVDYIAYMGWENGRSIPNIEQLKKMSEVFKVSLDELIANNETITLPDLKLENSIEIPFIAGADLSEEEGVPVKIIPITNQSDEAEDLEQTLETPVAQVAKEVTPVKKVVKEKPVKEKVVQEAPAQPKAKNNKTRNTIIIVLVAALALVGIVFGVTQLFKGDGSLNLSIQNEYRLAAADKFTAYLNNDGTITTRGSSVDLSSVKDGVAVSAKSDFAIVLLKNGKVVGSGSNTYGQTNVDKWEKIVAVSAGEKHAVGLQQDGKVVCTGDNSTKACEVTEWTDIEHIAAGDGFTIGIKKDGSVVVAGNINNKSQIESLTNVKKIVIGENEILALKSDKSVTCTGINSQTNLSASSWVNIADIAVGNGFIAGVSTSGDMYISTNDDELKETIESWSGIKYIAANSGYIVGIKSDGTMVGAGDNSYNQYVNESSEDDGEKLNPTANVTYKIDSKNVKFTWDKVENADYYLVEINIGTGYSVKSQEATLSVDQNKFEDGKQYSISIQACSSSDEKLNSEAFVSTFTFTKVETSPSPSPSPSVSPSPTPNTFTITWKNWDGSILAETNVASGATPGYNGANPTRPAEGTTTYNFTGWNPAVVTATANATYIAQFTAVTPTTTHGVSIVCHDETNNTNITDSGCQIYQVTEGDTYAYSAPTISGYTYTTGDCNGTMGTSDVTCIFNYTQP